MPTVPYMKCCPKCGRGHVVKAGPCPLAWQDFNYAIKPDILRLPHDQWLAFVADNRADVEAHLPGWLARWEGLTAYAGDPFDGKRFWHYSGWFEATNGAVTTADYEIVGE